MLAPIKSTAIAIAISLIGIVASTNITHAETLRTQNFEIKILRHCQEGNVSCDRVTYVGKSLTTGKSIRLKGKTINSGNSYRFLGYEFRNGKYRYLISDSNLLQIYRGDRLIAQEQGISIEDR